MGLIAKFNMREFNKSIDEFEDFVKSIPIVPDVSGTEEEMRKRVPKKTGALRKSLKIEATTDNASVSMLDYGKYVDSGTRRSKPHPFIEKMASTGQNKINKDLKAEGFRVKKHKG